MKNKSYKKILALTLAATLVGGNAVATFATESTTDTGVTASENRDLEDSNEKPITVTFKMSDEGGKAYFKATSTAESFFDEVVVGKYSYLPKIILPEGCELTGWEVSSDDEVKQPVKTLAAEQTRYTYDTVKGLKNPVITAVIKKKETVKPEVAVANAKVVVDLKKGSFDGYEGTTEVNTEHLEESDYTLGYLPTVTAKDGYKWTGWVVTNKAGETILDLGTDASSIAFNYGVADDYTVTAKFEEVKPEEKEARDVIVNFNVDPEKGEFTDPAGAKVVTFTIKEDDGNQYLVPTVEAKEGYVFTGWLVNGEDEGHWDADAKTFGVTGLAHFPKGSNEGYVTVTAQFEEVKPEVAVANANVVVDPDKGSFDGYDGATTLNNEHLEEADYTLGYLPTVTANDGYKWTGWVVTNKAGETILDLDTNASSIAFDYGVADTYTVTAKFEEVKPEVAVANANVVVDPEKGEFEGYDGATKLENNNLQEADYTLGFLPIVTAKEGYTWTGWEVTNKAGEVVYSLDTNTSSIAFPYGVEDDYTVTATFTKDETPVDPVDPVEPTEPTQPAQPATPSTDNTVNNTTNKTTDNKKVEKTAAKKAEAKNENKKAPKTGDESMPIAYMLTLVGAAVAAIIVLIKRKRTI